MGAYLGSAQTAAALDQISARRDDPGDGIWLEETVAATAPDLREWDPGGCWRWKNWPDREVVFPGSSPADDGIDAVGVRRSDGRVYFPLAFDAPDLESMVLSVKGGRNVGIVDLRDLAGVLEADEAAMAGLIVLHPLGEKKARNFRLFAQKSGTLTAYGRTYDRLQILTVPEILDGNRFDTPAAAGRGAAKPVIPGLKLPPKTTTI